MHLLKITSLVLLIAGAVNSEAFPQLNTENVNKEAGAPKNSAKKTWSVGAYTGSSVFDLESPADFKNPVFTAQQVKGISVDIVSHPFVLKEKSTFFMFYTAKNSVSNTGGIGVAESTDGLKWKYRSIAIQDTYPVSYPNVFKWKNDFYMTPETNADSSVKLYRALEFPDKWESVAVLLTGDKFISPTVFRYKEIWWMFTSPMGNETLRLFYADDLMGPWTEHPKSPVIYKDLTSARSAGRSLIIEGKLYRLGMDCIPNYGHKVRAFEVTELTKTAYSERMIDKPLIQATSKGWNSQSMHHLDAFKVKGKKWIGIVDAAGE